MGALREPTLWFKQKYCLTLWIVTYSDVKPIGLGGYGEIGWCIRAFALIFLEALDIMPISETESYAFV